MTTNETRAETGPPLVLVHGEVSDPEIDPAAFTPAERWAQHFAGSGLAGSDVLTIPPTRWIVPGWVPTHSLGMLYGEPGTGKSSVALWFALEAARGGVVFGGRKLRNPLRVRYFATERAELTRDRAEAWAQHNGTTIPDGFVLDGTPLDFTRSDHADGLVAWLEDLPAELLPHFVIVDTLAQTIVGADENAAGEMGEVWRNIGRIRDALRGGSVLVVHHSGKDKTRGARGSSASFGAVDYALSVDQAEDGDRLITVEVRKLNAGQRPRHGEEYRVQSVDLGRTDPDYNIPAEAGVVVRLGSARNMTAAERKALEVLRAVQELSGRLGGATFTRRDVENLVHFSGGHQQATDALGVLVDLGMLERTGGGRTTAYALTRKGHDQDPTGF